jgi:predicted AAA+ superfamily ATPase
VAKKNNEITYFQVTSTLNDSNYERESRVLLSQKDAYPKIILYVNSEISIKHDGIKLINLVD